MTFISLALLLKSKVDLFLYPPFPPPPPNTPTLTHTQILMRAHTSHLHTHARTH